MLVAEAVVHTMAVLAELVVLEEEALVVLEQILEL
jgi:hypothetical protein